MGNTLSEEAAPSAQVAPRELKYFDQDVQIDTKVDINTLAEIAERAGTAIMDIFHSDVENWEVKTKSDDSPLTRADQEANRIICEALRAWTPHIPIISEENKLMDFKFRQRYQYCWVVDPLDGTKEFCKRIPHFTVNIALVRGTAPIVGIVCTPAAQTIHYAVKGQGAWVRTRSASDKQIFCKEYDPGMDGIAVVGSASHMNNLTQEFMSQFKNPDMKQIGSSLKFLMIAEGLAHVYPRLAPTCEWDTAAAHIIVEEAGGSVIQAGRCSNKGEALEDWRTVLAQEKTVVYNKEDILNPFFVVYGKRKEELAAAAEAVEPLGTPGPDS